MFKKNIVLIGMMAAGKTTIGFNLAKKLNYNFFDIDSEIEKSENEKIVDIFQNKGEDYFRKIEEKITLFFSKKNNVVFSSIFLKYPSPLFSNILTIFSFSYFSISVSISTN